MLALKRVYVDPLGDDSFANELRENLIGALQASKRFEVVTDRNDADAVFRGTAKQVHTAGRNSSVVLELVNAGGQVIWSLSSRKDGRTVPNKAREASADILKVLLHDIESLGRRR